MTKTKARQRAKAKASQKAGKREAAVDETGAAQQPGKFTSTSGSIKGPKQSPSIRSFAGARSQAGRSR